LDEEPVVNQEILTRRMKHLRKSTDDFWRRWRSEYLNELREAHRYQQNKTAASAIKPGDVVIVHDPDVPRGLWKLGRVQDSHCLLRIPRQAQVGRFGFACTLVVPQGPYTLIWFLI